LTSVDDSSLWSNFSWPEALKAGSEMSGMPFSGNYDFIETTMHWPFTHMVPPAEMALDCASCHASNSRLAGLPGIYMPGHSGNLWLFAIFWHITTGEWRQYVPTRNGLFAVIRYYLIGTFTGEAHPYRKTTRAKHNPLQRLAYLFFKLMITPIIWLSGLLYLFYNDWPATLSGALELETVALAHNAAAFAMLIFIIALVYMATMGPTLTSLIKSMVTGYEDLEEHR